MAVKFDVTSGGQIEGRSLDEELKETLFGASATDIAVVNGLNQFMMQQLAIVLAIQKGWTFANAEAYVADHTTIIT